MLLMRQADPFICDLKGRTPLQYGKEKIKNQEWLATVVALLEDTMEINKTVFQRISSAFTLEQPIHKIRRSRKTMIWYISTMLVSQFCLMAFVFPFIVQESSQWLKTTICILVVVWALFGIIF